MLLTVCPNCRAQFKVSPDQLNVRQGRVMCGRCRSVFNAFQSLERVDSTFPAEALAALQQEAQETDNAAAKDSATETAVTPESPDKNGAGSAVGAEAPADTQSRDEQAAASRKRAQSASQRFESRRKAERSARAWRLAVMLLFLILAAQSAFLLRTEIISTFPAARPYFANVCERIGCALEWSRDESALRIESSDLIEEIGKPGRFVLTATLSNRSRSVQDFPHVELTLTDTNNQPLARRVLRPRDYLARPSHLDDGIAAGSEEVLNLRLESESERASGYHLLLFYP